MPRHRPVSFACSVGSSRPLPESKLLEVVRRRGSTISGQYETTRRNVFDNTGDVFLGVGQLCSNAVWVAPARDHVVASISEGGAFQWGTNVGGCMGGQAVDDIVKEDPDLYKTPAVRWTHVLAECCSVGPVMFMCQTGRFHQPDVSPVVCVMLQ